MEYLSKSEKKTFQIAANIAKKAKTGDIFALVGDLGSGKTTFVKGFARSLGIKREITSPTFVIMKQYPIVNPKKDIESLIHIDCYRLESKQDFESAGLREIFDNKNSVILIEWAEKIKKNLPKKAKNIYFSYIDETTRKIKIV